jgi:hypothetical protein
MDSCTVYRDSCCSINCSDDYCGKFEGCLMFGVYDTLFALMALIDYTLW